MDKKRTFRDNPSYIVKEICESSEISYNKAFNGLCSKKMISKYKNGEKHFDVFIFCTVLERLGFSAEHFEILVPDKVHEFFLWLKKCSRHIENQNWQALEQGIEDFKHIHLVNVKIQTSYRDYFIYILERYHNKNMDLAYEYIKKSLNATGQDGSILYDTNPLLSAFEWHLFINLCDMEDLLNIGAKTELQYRLYVIYLNKVKLIIDEDLKGRILPPIALFILYKYWDKLALDKRLGIEKNTIKIMVKSSTIIGLPTLIEYFIKDVESSCEEEVYTRKYGALQKIFKYVGVDSTYNISRLYGYRIRYVVLSDYLKFKRKELCLTCEKVSEGICSVENYRKIERGKIHPSTKNLISLAKKLEFTFIFLKGDIESGRYKYYLLAKECSKLIATSKFKSVQERISELKNNIDMQILDNFKYINLLETKMKEETRENKIAILQEVFNQEDRLSKYHICELIDNQVLSYLSTLIGKDCIKSLELFLENEKQKKYVNWCNIKEIVKALVHLYKEGGEYDKFEIITRKALKKMFEENDVSILVPLLEDVVEANKKEEDGYCSYKDIFYIAELYELYDDSRRIRKLFS